MSRINLFEKARENISKINDEFTQAINQPKHHRFEAYEMLIQSNTNVSTNRSLKALSSLLNIGRLQSGFRHAEQLALESGKNQYTLEDFNQYLLTPLRWHNALPYYIRRRVNFLKKFIDSEDHFFGALNPGNPGAAAKGGAYGEYCIVLKNDIFEKDAIPIAYCKYDTLAHNDYWKCNYSNGNCLMSGGEGEERHIWKNYCPVGKEVTSSYQNGTPMNKQEQLQKTLCEINEENLFSEYAPHSHRGRLAVIKHMNDIAEQVNWDIESIITYKDGTTEDYIEACFILKGGITFNHIEEIRIHPEILCVLFDEICIEESNLDQAISIFTFHKKIWTKMKDKNINFCPPWLDKESENNRNEQ